MENFINTPNLPTGKVSLVIVDGRIGKDIEENLRESNIKIIKTDKIPSLYEAVSYHPDIMLHHLGGNKIVAAPNISNRSVYELEEHGFEVIIGKKEVGAKYPESVPYNAARIGNFLICNVKYTDEAILDHADRTGLNIINVKQGYSKCSICIVSGKAAITADAGIHKALSGKGIDCCIIENNGIELFNMNYGFIGGATGYISDMELSFFGDIFIHPNYVKIHEFLIKYNKKVLNLSENKVRDFGTLIPLKEYSILTK